MGTWISHLRIAEKTLAHLSDVEPTAFIFGSLAPDSGIPNDDGSAYDPPKEVTHFIRNGNNEYFVCDLHFYRQYLLPVDHAQDPFVYSFLLGYFFHLICDRLWAERIGSASREAYQDLFTTHPEAEAWNLIKEDWYGLDHLFLRQHPEFNTWQVYLNSLIPQIPLPFLSQANYASQVEYIRGYYANPPLDRPLERSYPYMNEPTMTRFVDESAASLLKIKRLLLACPPPEALESATKLLPSIDTTPFPLPLGDSPLI